MEAQFFDIGANLTDPQFQGFYRGKRLHTPDLPAVLQRARDCGVGKIIVTAGCLRELQQAIVHCDALDPDGGFLYTTVGVHPTNCKELLPDSTTYLNELIQIARSRPDRVIAIGELGLDYDRTHFCDVNTQLKGFEDQLQVLLPALRLPLFLHMRAAAKPFIDILSRYYDTSVGGVVHSFTGTVEEVESLLSFGLDIGVNGCSLKTEENLRVVEKLPIDRIHFETDAPWCDMRPTHASWKHVTTTYDNVKKAERWQEGLAVKGRNEPRNISQVAEVVARLHGCVKKEDTLSLCSRIYQNSLRLFSRANNKRL